MDAAPDEGAKVALGVALADRLFLGGLRNLLAGVSAVAHHGAFHRSLARPDFPVRALARYQFAHAPGLVPSLRRTYRTTDRRLPWFVHVAEGTDERARGELDVLVRENVLRQNTVMIHAIALPAEKLPTVAEARACVVWCPEANRRLYGATADVRALVAAGVRVGLGSDSPATGVRDALSNLAAARARGGRCRTPTCWRWRPRAPRRWRGCPPAAISPGGLADLIVAESAERLLSGERAALESRARRRRAALRERGVDGPARSEEPAAVGGRRGRGASRPIIGRRAAALLRAPSRRRGRSGRPGCDLDIGERRQDEDARRWRSCARWR